MKKSKFVDPVTIVSSHTYKCTLKEINKIRRKNKKSTLKKLPRGIPEDPCKCPIATALKPIGVAKVLGSGLILAVKGLSTEFNGSNNVVVRGPVVFENFVNEFDGVDLTR